MKRSYTAVTSAASKTAFTGTSADWVLTLACGHKATAPKWRQGNRVAKPAPKRVVCRQCEAASQEAK